MVLIAHISDLHYSHADFNESMFLKAVDEINALNPDMIILTGDLTNHGYYSEYLEVKENTVDILEGNTGINAIVIIIVIIMVRRPASVCGVISPNPTVLNVTNSK